MNYEFSRLGSFGIVQGLIRLILVIQVPGADRQQAHPADSRWDVEFAVGRHADQPKYFGLAGFAFVGES